jgi:hypothetical protein
MMFEQQKQVQDDREARFYLQKAVGEKEKSLRKENDLLLQ